MTRKSGDRMKRDKVKLKRTAQLKFSPMKPPEYLVNKVNSRLIGVYREHHRKLTAIVSIDGGHWHMSLSGTHRLPTWDEIMRVRYHMIPDQLLMVMHLPPKEEYVNLHEFCLHLWELGQSGILPETKMPELLIGVE